MPSNEEAEVIQAVLDFGRSLRTLRESFQQAVEPFRRALDSIPEDKRRLVVESLSVRSLIEETEKAYYEEEKEICKILASREWWVRLDEYFTREELVKICQLGRDSSKVGNVDELICRKFRDDEYAILENMVGQWGSLTYLSDRKIILREALTAHKQAMYAVSIPSLLPLIDGFAHQFDQSVRPRSKAASKKRGRRRMSFDLEKLARYYRLSETKIVRETCAEWQECLWSKMFEMAIKGSVYGRYSGGLKPPPSTLNRHAILHGWAVDYASEANSLRCFLLLDVYVAIALSVMNRLKRPTLPNKS